MHNFWNVIQCDSISEITCIQDCNGICVIPKDLCTESKTFDCSFLFVQSIFCICDLNHICTLHLCDPQRFMHWRKNYFCLAAFFFVFLFNLYLAFVNWIIGIIQLQDCSFYHNNLVSLYHNKLAGTVSPVVPGEKLSTKKKEK